MNKNSYHHGDLKKAILEASLDIIETRGSENLTIRSAAGAIGVSHSAPYRHFSNKQELLKALAIHGLTLLFEALSGAVNNKASTAENTASAGREYLSFARKNRELYRIMFGPSIGNKTGDPEFYAAHDRAFQALMDLLDPSSEQEIQKRRLSALAAWSMLHGYAMFLIDNPESSDMGSQKQINMMLEKLKRLV